MIAKPLKVQRKGNKAWASPAASRSVLLFAMAAMLLILDGCMGYLRTCYPIRSEVPVVLFDRYEVDISGFCSGPSRSDLYIQISTFFLKTVPEGTRIDTIPIFLVEEVCADAGGVAGATCHRALENTYIERNDFPRAYPLPGGDLWIRYGAVLPSQVYVEPILGFLSGSDAHALTFEIRARLLDRKTRMEIDRVSKRITCEIRKEPAG